MLKRIINFFHDTMSFNKTPSLCVIKKRSLNLKTKQTFFTFDIIGLISELTIEASDIVKNKDLLKRFSSDDKNEIIFHSGICLYKITDSCLDDKGRWLITVQANFDNKSYSKKFFPEEILTDQLLLKKLSYKEQLYTYSLSNESKVIPFIRASSSMNSIAL